MNEYDEAKVDAALDAVWQSLFDDQLRSLTQSLFGAITVGFLLTEEELADAWYEFSERRMRVFG